MEKPTKKDVNPPIRVAGRGWCVKTCATNEGWFDSPSSFPVLLDHRSVQNWSEKRKNHPSTDVSGPTRHCLSGVSMAWVAQLDSTSANPTVGNVLFIRRYMARVSVAVEERRYHPLGWAKSQGLAVTELGSSGCPEEGARWWHWPPRLSAFWLFSAQLWAKGPSEKTERVTVEKGSGKKGKEGEGRVWGKWGWSRLEIEIRVSHSSPHPFTRNHFGPSIFSFGPSRFG